MSGLTYALLAAYAVINVFTFIVYGADKLKAKRGAWRISERTLLLLAAAFGALGALLAMELFRHKTKHKSFTIIVPVLLVIQIALAILYFTKWA